MSVFMSKFFSVVRKYADEHEFTHSAPISLSPELLQQAQTKTDREYCLVNLLVVEASISDV